MKLLDLYCCAGGAAMGYHQAGFEIVGVDVKPQRHYPFKFIQADVLALDPSFIANFDAIHASPPCQAHTFLNQMWNSKEHPNLIPDTRTMLKASGRPWIIENVMGAKAHMINPIMLCGTMFGLGAEGAELRRHRLFETNFLVPFIPECRHEQPRVIGVYGGHGRDRRRKFNGQDFSTEARRIAMGIAWQTGTELSQAIPPAYTKYLGQCLMASLKKNWEYDL